MAALLPSQNTKTKPVVYTAIQVQTSSQGIPVPVAYGTVRMSDNLLWYSGFKATKVTQGGKGGSLGGAAGKNDGAQYKYSANIIFGVCEGPIQGYGQVWATKSPTTISQLGLTSFTGTYPQAAWGFVTTNYPSQARPYTGIAYLGAANYQLGASADLPTHTFEVYGFFSNRKVYTAGTIPSSGARTITIGSRTWANGTTQSMWVSDDSVPGFTKVGGAPAAGQYSVTAGVYTFNAADSGTAVTIIWNGKGQDADPSLIIPDMLTSAYYGMGFPDGTVGEFTTYAEDHAIPGSPYQVTVTEAANFNDNLCVYEPLTGDIFTCVSGSPGPLQYSYTAGGTYTFNSADSGKTVNIAYAALDASLPYYQDYVWAAGFFVSLAYINQQSGATILEELARYTNSEIVWSAGALKLVPRGDKDLSANGHTYTAPATTVKDLGDDDYIMRDGDPVEVTRKPIAQQKNVVQIECIDRTKQYNAAVVDATDQAAVDLYGRRPTGNQNAHLFADPTIARTSAQLLLQREGILNSFAVRVGVQYAWLDPMDIVSLTDSYLGLDSSSWVRIVGIEENEDGTFDLTCEDYADGASNSESYDYGTGDGYAANYNVDPGDVNDPIIFEPSVQLATNTGLQVWCAVSGPDENWGGCDVYVSTDGITYNYVGRQWGAARQGVLTADFPSHTDPDTVDTLSVDLTESFGELVSGTVQDADLGNTVCLVDAEMVSFETATLTGSYAYDLTDYIRRGQFGTTIAAHTTGAPFARLDEQIFAFPYDKDQIGQTVYVKFCSFNSYGGGLQDISAVTAYTHTIVGPPLPGTVQNFGITQQGGPVVFSWDDLPDFVLKGYDILYGDTSGTVDTATFLTDASRSTEMTHANVPPGTWTFYIRGHDLADQVGPATSMTFTVRNFNYEIATQQGEYDWFGTLTDLVKHPSLVLVPQGINLASSYGWEVFDEFVPDPEPTGYYEMAEVDSGADGSMRVVLNEVTAAATAYGETGAAPHTGQIKYRTSTGSYGPFEDWLSGTVNAEFVTARLVLDNSSVANYGTKLDLLLDNPPLTEVQSNVAIDSGGTLVAWGIDFRTAPNVQVTPVGSGATSGTAENITEAGATIRLWNGTTAVSGTANIAATGV